MSSRIGWTRAIVSTALIVILLGAAAHLYGQAPGVPQAKWSRAAVFPEPEEELYGVAASGKMYVMGGYGADGKPVGMNWEYDPGSDKWTRKKGLPLAAHHAALVEFHGKIYV